MVDQQFGVGEYQTNVAGDYNVTIYPTRYELDFDEDEDDDDDRLDHVDIMWIGGVVLFVVAVAFAAIHFVGGKPFPRDSDRWPAGVRHDAIAAAVNGWFGNCAASESASPANCPQSLDEEGSPAHWAFYGDPLEGAVIHYDKGASRFDILGTVVASVDYGIATRPRRAVTPITYWAKVDWTGGVLEVRAIDEHSAAGNPPVTKRDPRLAWTTKLKDAFARCTRGASSAMPAGCPAWQPPSEARKVTWSLTGDPLLTARASFDPKYGIVRVTGTYGMTVRYALSYSTKTRTESRGSNYEATIAPGAAGPVVLQIRETD